MIKMLKNNKYWFTLIEIILWILIFSIAILWWFYSLNSLNLWKVNLMQNVWITKDSYYFSEKLFSEIKKWWSLDFEEYFNRKVVNEWATLIYLSWHYLNKTWFGNFWHNWTLETNWYWSSFYYCRSSTTNMWTWWCYSNNYNSIWTNVIGFPQRYGQYRFQFIDYNSNFNDENLRCSSSWWWYWDEDCDLNIRGDDDDENLWIWPVVFTWWTDVKELYLISWDWKKRTLFRWSVIDDPKHPSYNSSTKSNWNCNYGDWSNPTWSWCLWNIEFLKLDWKDWWINHDEISTSTWSFDWIIDTWLVDKKFSSWDSVVAWSSTWSYWQSIFPTSINVKSFKVYAYPNVDIYNSWKDTTQSSNINPYIRINIILTPSWEKIPTIKWTIPEMNLSTTINLADYFD